MELKTVRRDLKWTFAICTAMVLLATSCAAPPPPPAPYGALPSEKQMDWHKLGYYMFIHFGPNTFTGVEWGDGKENPKVFNPTALDCRQWAATAKAAGMKGIIITAKHHDGFCLWPSNYSTHTVRESAWKDGNGDVLKELSDACKEYGLKFGVYLSPWDQNHPSSGMPEYNEVFANTLTEVLTNYGEVFEQWFDGANGDAHKGKRQVYDWPLFHETVYKHQPQALIFSDIGPDARWMGNERGIAGETNWATLDTAGYEPGLGAPDSKTLNEGKKNGEAWVPAEVDVSIRSGWFYNQQKDMDVKSLAHLVDIYYTSIGRNGNFLLNVPPTQKGLIHSLDSTRLMELKAFIDKSFETDLIVGAKLKASNTRGDSKVYAVANLINGEYDSYWATDDEVKQAEIEIILPAETAVNCLLLQEYIPLGQRIEKFTFERWDDSSSAWIVVSEGTTIGYKRILRFPQITAKRFRLTINESLASPVMNTIGLYNAPELIEQPELHRKDGNLIISNRKNTFDYYYTTDGSEPTTSSINFADNREVGDKPVTIKMIAVTKDGNFRSEASIRRFDYALSRNVVRMGGKQSDVLKSLIDEDTNTWASLKVGERYTLNLAALSASSIKGVRIIPVRSVDAPNVQEIKVYANHPQEYKTISFDNIKNNPVPQEILFSESIKPQELFITIGRSTTGSPEAVLAEVEIITE